MEANHVTIKTKFQGTDVPIHAELKHSLSVLVSHQFVLIMAQLFVETVESEEVKLVMTETPEMAMVALTSAKMKLHQ